MTSRRALLAAAVCALSLAAAGPAAADEPAPPSPAEPPPAQAATSTPSEPAPAIPASSAPGFLVNSREPQALIGGPSRARLSATDPTSPAERQARFEVTHPKCALSNGALFPGLGSLCAGRTTEGSLVLALGLAYTEVFEGGLSTRHLFERPNLFGRTVNTLPGMLAGGGIGVGLFTHVALAEELAFRGLVQSGFTRSKGEEQGMVLGALVFGLFHSTNALFLPADQRVDYLVKAVPFITLVGGYLSYVYAKSGYSLSPSIAVHFWYDFLIEAASFAMDPKNSPLSMRITF